jgi:GDP-D-mannose dehydratase
MEKVALITGVTGQDDSYLADLVAIEARLDRNQST